jgi:hypothetical protein
MQVYGLQGPHVPDHAPRLCCLPSLPVVFQEQMTRHPSQSL